MDLGLAGKRALVTGSSSGIGAGIARMLSAEGCTVVVHGRDAGKAQSVADSIGGDTRVAVGDLSTNAGADAVVETAGEIDILVNNAGVPWGHRPCIGRRWMRQAGRVPTSSTPLPRPA